MIDLAQSTERSDKNAPCHLPCLFQLMSAFQDSKRFGPLQPIMMWRIQKNNLGESLFWVLLADL
jgi:hypothetical protein